MTILPVVVWACLAVIAATAENTLHPQPPPLPLLLAQGRHEPHNILTDTLNPGLLGNSVKDLGASEKTSEGDTEENVPGPLRFSAPHERTPSVPHASSEAILPHLTSSGLTEEGALNHMLWSPSRQRRVHPAATTRHTDSTQAHTRQKRYTLKYKIRSIAVPLSVFNFLGFLPVRVPGLPFHNDLPSPDYSHYETKYDVYVPRYRRRKTFRRF
ncbi:hypothetical protein E2C01_043418 [Portunus trituberculatus]|uniref:Uncharacterized protein n=1 Tax=Portunus trituberculatus TaxID=210409 RepID=A0A5B7FPF8_PORTR|nr:hypothetical protein [Portunus trituberculatus]